MHNLGQRVVKDSRNPELLLLLRSKWTPTSLGRYHLKSIMLIIVYETDWCEYSGLCGWTTRDMIRKADEEVTEAFGLTYPGPLLQPGKHQIVVLMAGTNDLGATNAFIIYERGLIFVTDVSFSKVFGIIALYKLSNFK